MTYSLCVTFNFNISYTHFPDRHCPVLHDILLWSSGLWQCHSLFRLLHMWKRCLSFLSIRQKIILIRRKYYAIRAFFPTNIRPDFSFLPFVSRAIHRSFRPLLFHRRTPACSDAACHIPIDISCLFEQLLSCVHMIWHVIYLNSNFESKRFVSFN